MSFRKVVQIKGANGSGKTTIVKQLIALEVAEQVCRLSNKNVNKGKPYATLLPNLKWIVVGQYPVDAKGGGCDTIHTMDELKAIVDKLVAEYPDHWIVFEGAMISSTMTMYYHIRDRVPYPVAVLLVASLEGCVARLERRKGVTPGSTDFNHVEDKVQRILRQDHLYDPIHIRHIMVENLPEQEMVYEFLAAVGWDPELGSAP